MDEILLEKDGVKIFLRKSTRAKRLRLQVDSDLKMTLVVPKRTPKFMVNLFMGQHERWIDGQVEKISKQKKIHPDRLTQSGDIYYYFGEKLTLKVLPQKLKRPSVRVSGHELEVKLNKSISKSEAKRQIKNAVEKFYRKKAEEVIHDRLQFFNEQYGFKYNRVTLRNQKSRWGSCSRLKNLNFNWRLIMAPIEVIDYVVVHELCHLRQMNHSAKFWSLVEKAIPHPRKHRLWLRENHFLLTH